MPSAWNFYCHTDVHLGKNMAGIRERLEGKTIIFREWDNIKAVHQIQSPLFLSTSCKVGSPLSSSMGSKQRLCYAKSLQSCPTLCDPIDGSHQAPPHPWDSPGKNTGVGCHFLLQCMKVKSESEVAQSCPTLSHPMDCSLPGYSIHGIFQAKVLEWGAFAFSETEARRY